MGTNDPEGDILTDDILADGEDNQDTQTDNQTAQDDANTAQDVATDPAERWKGDVQLSKFKSLTDLEKAYKNLETKLGAESVKVPGENATDEEWSTFFKRAGRPDTPDGYGLEKGTAPDEGLANFAQMCHQAGLTKRQAQNLWKMTTEKANAAVQSQREQGSARIAEWKKQVMAKADADATYLPTAKKGAKKVQEFYKLMKDHQLSNHPEVINLCYNLGKLTSEDSFEGGGKRGGTKPQPGDADYVWAYPNSPGLK